MAEALAARGVEMEALPTAGRQIAFVRRGDLFVANRSASDDLAITNTPVVERTPSFSPSGNKLVFATEFRVGQPGTGHIVTIGVDGKDRTELTQSDQPDFSPSYSPSGNKIVFTRLTDDGTTQAFKMDAEGSNRDQLTFSASSVDAPTWSPDGNRIAFDLIANNAQSILSIEPDGSNRLRLTTRPRENNREPSYSPSGNKLVYRGVTTPGGDDQALFVIPAGGGSPEQLTAARDSGVDADPYWGPTP